MMEYWRNGILVMKNGSKFDLFHPHPGPLPPREREIKDL
jgi:hypothetical protein